MVESFIAPDAMQTLLVSAWASDTELLAALGGAFVFDAPPKGQIPPYVTVIRHDVTPRDGDLTPGAIHRIVVQCWHPLASRRAVLTLSDRIVAVALNAALSSEGLLVVNRQFEKLETAIDLKTGHARANVTLRFFIEPAA